MVVGYKLARAAVSALGALALTFTSGSWLNGWHELVVSMARRHALPSSLGRHAMAALLAVTDPAHSRLIVAALFLDAALLSLEGWALWTGKRWGAWLLVGLTGAVLAFELFELWKEPSFGRAVIIAINIVILAWVLHHARRGRSG